MAEHVAGEAKADPKQPVAAQRAELGGAANTSAPGLAVDLLRLQRSVGNRAVGQLVADGGAGSQGGGPSKRNETGLPDGLKSGVESLSGLSMEGVKVHYDSSKPAEVEARAYTQGSDIHVAPGQERHLPHEAWHVVQQAQGRVAPTMQLKGGAEVNEDAGLEHEADVMGAKAAQTGAGSEAPVVGRRPGLFRSVLQLWVDHRGKWHDPPPGIPDKAEWEPKQDSKKNTYYQPIQGTNAWILDQQFELQEQQKKQQAQQQAAAKSQQWKLASDAKDYVTPFLEDASKVRYTQDSIANTFSSGKPINGLWQDLKAGKATAASVPPLMVQYDDGDGHLYSYDNRRLWCFKKAKLQVRCRFGSPAEIKQNGFKITGDGMNIKVRK